jgi:hypothetical protein
MDTTIYFKRYLYLCLCLLFPALSHGQLIKSLAVKAGGSIANQDWRYLNAQVSDSKHYNKTGAFGALELEFLKGKTLGLGAEFSYCQKGFREKITFVTSDGDPHGTLKMFNFNYNYFSFSPFLTFNHETSNWSTYLGIGPRIDFFTNTTIDGHKSNNQHANATIFGATASGGLAYKVGNMSLFTELKFLYDAGYAIDNGNLQAYNRAAVLCFGFRQRMGN